MVKYCSADGCQSVWFPNSGISFHSFPLQRLDVLEKWVHAMNRKNFKPNTSSCLCSEHFTMDSYVETTCEKRVLKKDAVPSIFDLPDHLQPQLKMPERQLIIHVSPKKKQCPTLDPLMVIKQESPSYSVAWTQTTNYYSPANFRAMKLQVKGLQQKVRRKDVKIKKLIKLLKTVSGELLKRVENTTTPI